jgi:hypothetical protein
VITSINSSVNINDNCEVFSFSCVHFTPYNTFKIKSQVEDVRSSMLLAELQYDVCNKKRKKNSEPLQLILLYLGIPELCQVKNSFSFCNNGSKSLQLSDFAKKMVPLAAASSFVKFKINTQHDTGNSCFEALLKYTKKQ